METTYLVVVGDSGALDELGADSVDLVVPSPPYPMIERYAPQVSYPPPIVNPTS